MEQLKGIDEEEMLETMPERLHRDVAMDMHFEILKKVKLFEGCDEQLLIDLVLYLRKALKGYFQKIIAAQVVLNVYVRPILFLPGQFVCKKGEVGKEMYIIRYESYRII